MALYLKYRPKDFNTLVGQDFIRETLKTAVSQDKTVGAYLFCGPRGTGKTSSARIMAKAINCLNNTDGNPCNNCNICDSINTESLVDVIEIDAASYTGVDNIRGIIEKAQFRPSTSKYKVYIIDEVHMLSKGAFNALLKILEEPPKYVKFILATTETHKVPETIISRCQKYDFKRISNNDIIKRLEYIAKEENIIIDEESLKYISKSSAGGLRNAISLFEQLITNNEIKYENIVNNLGIIQNEQLESFTNKLINKDSSIIGDFDLLISDGKNIKLFFKELFFHIKEKSKNDLLKGNNILNLVEILSIIDDTFIKTKNSIDENTTFLIGILKIISGYKENNYTNNNQKHIPVNTISKPENNKNTQISSTNTIKQSKNTENTENTINKNDIDDIFGGENENSDNSITNQEKNTLTPIDSKNSNNFNIEKLIDSLKKLGAKGAVTMGIRGANCIMNQDILSILVKTEFALNKLNTADNILLINQALEQIGQKDIKIEIKL